MTIVPRASTDEVLEWERQPRGGGTFVVRALEAYDEMVELLHQDRVHDQSHEREHDRTQATAA